jgi:hypothetical protein
MPWVFIDREDQEGQRGRLVRVLSKGQGSDDDLRVTMYRYLMMPLMYVAADDRAEGPIER